METTDATAQAHAKTIDALTERLRLANEELKQYRQRTVGEEQTHGLRQCSRAVDVSKSSFVIDATNFGNQSHFVNDCRDISKSGKPNAEFVNRVEKGGDCNAKMWLKCIKTIVKGQEILVNYGDPYWNKNQGQYLEKNEATLLARLGPYDNVFFINTCIPPVADPKAWAQALHFKNKKLCNRDGTEMPSKTVEVKKCPANHRCAGQYGVFARHQINKGSWIIAYTGQ